MLARAYHASNSEYPGIFPLSRTACKVRPAMRMMTAAPPAAVVGYHAGQHMLCSLFGLWRAALLLVISVATPSSTFFASSQG